MSIAADSAMKLREEESLAPSHTVSEERSELKST